MCLSSHRARMLIFCLVVFAAVFVIAFPFDSDGDLAVAASAANEYLGSAGELCWDLCSIGTLSWTWSDCDGEPLHASPVTRLRLRDPGLLAAVPGGLCLLL